MAQLPEELIDEILQWLPVRSLLRFRCLSKSLCAVINSPDFINSHLCKSSQNFNLRKLIFSCRSKFHVCDMNIDLEEEILHLENPVSSLSDEVCGNCKGLLLLRLNKFSFVLWNPSTRERRNLPDCPFKRPSGSSLIDIVGSGLGYDDSIDDYKAVVMVYVKGETRLEVQVWIYGLKSNNWRRTQKNFPYLGKRMYEDPGMGYFADGSLLWICTLSTNRNGNQPADLRKEIVAFDIGKETFSLVSQPVICSINTVVPIRSRLQVLEGCLCIYYVHGFPRQVTQADLYMRKKDGVDNFTWTQLFSVTESLHFHIYWFNYLKVLGYSKSRYKILLDFGLTFMLSYDLTQKTFGEVQVVDKDPAWETSVICLESLVSVNHSS